MALTPEDVINKRFQPTKFREGYDQDEVDDFLDEIVVELRRLNQENAELRERLEGADAPTAASEAETSSAVSAQDSAQEQETVEPVSAPVAEQPEAPATLRPRPRRPRLLPSPLRIPTSPRPRARPACSPWPRSCTTSTSARVAPSAIV